MRKYPCPIPDYDGVNDDGEPDYYVTLPPVWLVKHNTAKGKAIDIGEESGLDGVALTFAVSLALADDFRLPGLDGKPENWNFQELPLELATWVNFIVWGDFNKDFTVKKNYLLASMNGNIKAPVDPAGEIGTT